MRSAISSARSAPRAPGFAKGIQRFNDHPLVGETRSVGLIGAVELVRDKQTKEIFDPKLGVPAYCVKRAQEHGLIIRAIVNSIAFCPPLVSPGRRSRKMYSALRPRPRRDLGLGQGPGPRQRGVRGRTIFARPNVDGVGKRDARHESCILPRLGCRICWPLTGC